MDDDLVNDGDTRRRPDAVRVFRLHLLAYVVVGGLLFLVDLMTPGSWWFIWPIFGWGVAVAAHWLYVKSLEASEEWVRQRTEDVRLRAYDVSHMLDIHERRKAREHLRRPAAKPRE